MTGRRGFIEWYKANQYKKLTPQVILKKLNEFYDNRLNIGELDREINIAEQEMVAQNRAKAITDNYLESKDLTMEYIVKGGKIRISKEIRHGYNVVYFFKVGDVQYGNIKDHVQANRLTEAVYGLLRDAYVA